MKKNGFTLVETMVAMFIALLVIFGVATSYINAINLIKKSGYQLRAQQEAILAMNKVGDSVRESINLNVYNFIPPSTWVSLDEGNFLVTYGPQGSTSAFYYVENNLYCVPSFTESGFGTNTKYLLTKCIKDTTYFHSDAGNVFFNLEIWDSDEKENVLFDVITRFTSRN